MLTQPPQDVLDWNALGPVLLYAIDAQYRPAGDRQAGKPVAWFLWARDWYVVVPFPDPDTVQSTGRQVYACDFEHAFDSLAWYVAHPKDQSF